MFIKKPHCHHANEEKFSTLEETTANALEMAAQAHEERKAQAPHQSVKLILMTSHYLPGQREALIKDRIGHYRRDLRPYTLIERGLVGATMTSSALFESVASYEMLAETTQLTHLVPLATLTGIAALATRVNHFWVRRRQKRIAHLESQLE